MKVVCLRQKNQIIKLQKPAYFSKNTIYEFYEFSGHFLTYSSSTFSSTYSDFKYNVDMKSQFKLARPLEKYFYRVYLAFLTHRISVCQKLLKYFFLCQVITIWYCHTSFNLRNEAFWKPGLLYVRRLNYKGFFFEGKCLSYLKMFIQKCPIYVALCVQTEQYWFSEICDIN